MVGAAAILMWGLPSALLAGPPPPATVSATDSEPGWVFSVHALQSYRFRTMSASDEASSTEGNETSTEEDHDLRLYLASSVREPHDRFAAHVSMALWGDLDGVTTDGPTGLSSMYDHTSPHFFFDVYELSAEYRSKGVLSHVRAGRQGTEYGTAVVFDGASLKLRALGRMLQFFVYGGRTVHFFETDADLFEDFIASGGVIIRPIPQLLFELDYRFSYEDTATAEGLQEHFYGLTAKFRLDDWMYLKGYARGLTDKFSHAGFGALLQSHSLGIGANLAADAQTARLSEVSEANDPFLTILGTSLPHVRLRADVWKDLDTAVGTLSFHLGWNARLLTTEEDGEFNRDYGRAYLQFQWQDIGVRGPFVDVALEYHYTHADDDQGLVTAGGAAGFAHNLFKVRAGTYYQQYKYNYYKNVGEVADVRTVFVESSVRPVKWLNLKARYEWEAFGRDVHALTIALAQAY